MSRLYQKWLLPAGLSLCCFLIGSACASKAKTDPEPPAESAEVQAAHGGSEGAETGAGPVGEAPSSESPSSEAPSSEAPSGEAWDEPRPAPVPGTDEYVAEKLREMEEQMKPAKAIPVPSDSKP